MDDESNAGVEIEEEGSDLDEGVEEDESLSSEDSETDDTDWKALYEKEAEEKENYKKALDQKRQLRKKPKPVVEESSDDVEEDDGDENRPLTLKDLERRDAVKTVESTLANLVKDPEKRKLVRLYYDTRVRHTGTSDDAILSDLQTALDIADAKRLRKTTSEMTRAANQDKTPPFGGSSSDRAPADKDHKFSAEQVQALTDAAKRLGADPAKFIADAWKNQQGR